MEKTRRGGLVALDTPNLAGFWNRRKLAAGESIFQDVKSQFYSEIPFEGHHREYTGAEVEWMLKEIGLSSVTIKYFDYGIFEFNELTGPHIDHLTSMIKDPTMAGLILATGTKS
jgi:hypothetical protein